jgi:nitrite reductase/ring-hydroxylating ferredoxin subunit
MAAEPPKLAPVLVMLTDDLVITRRLLQLAQALALDAVEAEQLRSPPSAPEAGEDKAGPDSAMPQPAAAVIDLRLPDALDRLRSWRERWPDTVLTGFLSVPDRDSWVAAQRAGCDLVANRGALIPRLRDRLERAGDHAGRRFPLFEAADAAGRLGLVYRAADSPVGPLAVFQVAGRLHAIADQCPHAGSALSGGEIDAAVITCPEHGSRFDICTGERLRGPADHDIEVFPLVREGGQVCLLIR